MSPPHQPTFTSAHDRSALARARGQLGEHRRQFRALERHALAAEDATAAAGRAQWALDAGARRHPGLLVSTSLERRLHEIGRAEIPGSSRPRRGGSGGAPERVLHVLTQCYEYGGHTRVVERWMRIDAGRTPTVLLTGQAGNPVPATLHEAARSVGGAVVELSAGDILTRARTLRSLAEQHDLVVLHTHPQDVVPALALADPARRPPTILFNHASDHIWIGVAAADVVASLWEYDDRQTRERRGVPADGSLLLPIPVAPTERPERSAARRELGIDPDARLVLAIGSGYKVAPVLEPSFTELVGTVLEGAADARCVVVGPAPDAGWAALRQATGGRVTAVGRQDSRIAAALMCAADVLLDTWPASGATTLLDAALSGLPVVSLGDGSPERALVRPPAGTLGGAMVHAQTPAAAAEAVAALLADEARRTALADRARDHVRREHLDGWPAHLEATVAGARGRAGQAAPPESDPAPGASDWECVLHLLHEAAGEVVPLEQTLMACAADLPAPERPAGPADAEQRVAAILAAHQEPVRRGVCAPALESRSVARLVAEAARLTAGGEIDSCAVVVSPAHLDSAVALLEAALQDSPEVEIELVAADGVHEIVRPGDIVLAP